MARDLDLTESALRTWMTFELGDRFETHAEAKTKLFDYIEV